MTTFTRGLAAVLCIAVTMCVASAEDAFKARQVRMVIGYGPGGGYDLYGRAVARHIGRHLPGHPAIVPQNMPGAGSITAANHIYNIAPKDGSVIGIIARDAVTQPLMTEHSGAKFDAMKMSWLGSATAENFVCIASQRAKAKSIDDLMTTELVVGGAGAGSGTEIIPKALNGLLRTKIRVVGGYPGSTEVFLAMERGEVDGFCASYSSVAFKYADAIEAGTIKVLFQAAEKANPKIKAPFLLDSTKTPEERQALYFLFSSQILGRPFIAPPDLPPPVLAALRTAFDQTLGAQDFLRDAEKQKLEVEPVQGAEIEQVVRRIYATPKSVIDRVKAVLGGK